MATDNSRSHRNGSKPGGCVTGRPGLGEHFNSLWVVEWQILQVMSRDFIGDIVRESVQGKRSIANLAGPNGFVTRWHC